MNNSSRIIKLYGITRDSETSNFIMVMDYAQNGNLRHQLNKNFNSMTWWENLAILRDIACGLNNIHKEGLTHQDFHSGNILNRNQINILTHCTTIADLGLCKPAD